MCPIQFRQEGPPWGPPAFMAFDLFERLLEQFEGLKELHLQGLGEPLMHPRFFDMVELATARGIRVTTNSNLNILNHRRAVACVTSGLQVLHVSIDGARAATYEGIRARGNFERLLTNIRKVTEAKELAGSELPHLHIVMVLMQRNLAELPALVDLAANLGAEELFVQRLAHDFHESALPAHYLPMRSFVDEETLVGFDETTVAATFEAARGRAAEAGIRLRLPPVRSRGFAPGTPGRERCSWPWSSAYVSWDGKAMPCCMVATPDRCTLGDFARDGVSGTWHSPAYEDFRERLDSPQPPDVCASCSLYHGRF